MSMGMGLWSEVLLLMDKHDLKAFSYKAGEITVATKEFRFKRVSFILPVPCDTFPF